MCQMRSRKNAPEYTAHALPPDTWGLQVVEVLQHSLSQTLLFSSLSRHRRADLRSIAAWPMRECRLDTSNLPTLTLSNRNERPDIAMMPKIRPADCFSFRR